MREYTLGLSPCPNDTFIFHALLAGSVALPFRIVAHMADVEELNSRVRRSELPFSKISVGAYGACMDQYAILSAGGALGFGCGPLVVAKRPLDEEELRTATVAIPGAYTTANLLLGLTGRFQGPRKVMLFSDVIGAVARGETDLGVIIHEGRFTYEQHGLCKILDLGEWWEGAFTLPLPLGCIVVRRDIAKEDAAAVEMAIQESLRIARQDPSLSRSFIKSHAQELSDEVIEAHIKTFVTDFSLTLGSAGEAAVLRLVEEAARIGAKKLPREGIFFRSPK